MATTEEIEYTLEQKVVSFTIDGMGVHVPLCQTHYNNLYTQINTVSTCASCGGRPKRGDRFNRHCPNPGIVNSVLTTVTNETSGLTKESIICTACYKYFKVMIKNVQEGRFGASSECGETKRERNQNIEFIITELDNVQVSIYNRRETVTIGECIIGKYVGEKMKEDEAMLLPNLYRDFIHELHAHKTVFPQVCVCNNEIPTSRWFLSHLHAHFENVLEVQCRHKRFGTLLYHKSCDLIHALSLALGRTETREEKTKMPDLGKSVTELQPSLPQQMNTVAVYLNNKLHQRAKVLKQSFEEAPESIANLNITVALDEADTELLTFLSKLTQPVRHSRRKLFESSPMQMDQSSHTRNVRLYFALSVLVFCTNATCSSPLHVLITEAVLCHGGTQQLVRILNRLGAAACLDTVNRLATQVVEKRVSSGALSDLVPQPFAAVSIDNIDILQPFGFVSCQDATRSWHGTSVQCTQPLPLSAPRMTSFLLLQYRPLSVPNVHAVLLFILR